MASTRGAWPLNSGTMPFYLVREAVALSFLVSSICYGVRVNDT